jgi:hypothetical protein
MINRAGSPLPFKEATEVFDTLTATQEKTQTQDVVLRKTTTPVAQSKLAKRKENWGNVGIAAGMVSVTGIFLGPLFFLIPAQNEAIAEAQAERETLDSAVLNVSDSLETYYDQNKAYPDQISALIEAAAQKTGIPASDFCYAPQSDRNNQNYIFGVDRGEDKQEVRISAISDGHVEYIMPQEPNCFD